MRCQYLFAPQGSSAYGVKTEIKNLNSFRAVQRALEFEADRQRRLLQAKEVVLPETRHWDEAKGMTFSMRSKAKAADYRYMPDLISIRCRLTRRGSSLSGKTYRNCPMLSGIGL